MRSSREEQPCIWVKLTYLQGTKGFPKISDFPVMHAGEAGQVHIYLPTCVRTEPPTSLALGAQTTGTNAGTYSVDSLVGL